MSLYLKIVLVIFGLAYLISPVDIIPDLLIPYIGFLDDGVVIAALIYLLRTGRLPDFVFKNKTFKGQSQTQKKKSGTGANTKDKKTRTATISPSDILGVPADATKKQIQDAYKKAIKKYHPDKLSHLGKEFSDLANEKFVQIQAAYDELMKKFQA